MRYDGLNMNNAGSVPTGVASSSQYYDGASGCCETCLLDPTCGGFVAVIGNECYFKDIATVNSEIPPSLVDSNTITFYRESLVYKPPPPPLPPSIPGACSSGGGFVRYENSNIQTPGNPPTGAAAQSTYYDGANGCCETCMSDPTCGGFVAVSGQFPTCYYKDTATVSSEIPPALVESGVTTFYKETLVYVPAAPPNPPRMTCGTGGGYTRYDNKNMQNGGTAPTGVAANSIYYSGGDECCELCGNDATCGGFIAVTGDYPACYFKERYYTVQEVPPALDDPATITFYKDDVVEESYHLKFNGLVRVDFNSDSGWGNAHWGHSMENERFVVESNVPGWTRAAVLWDGCLPDTDGDCAPRTWSDCNWNPPRFSNCNNIYSGYFGQVESTGYVKTGIPPARYWMKLHIYSDSGVLVHDCFNHWPSTIGLVNFEVKPNQTTVISGTALGAPYGTGNGDPNAPSCLTGSWGTSYETIESRFPGLVPAVEEAPPPPPPRTDPTFVPPLPLVAVVAIGIGNTLSVFGLSITGLGLVVRMTLNPTQPQIIERTPMLAVKL